MQTIIDERANPQKREAIEAISHGRETEPGSLIWQVMMVEIEREFILLTGAAPWDYFLELNTHAAMPRETKELWKP
jgi:hypothetical protein